jgi:hypothetical protein
MKYSSARDSDLVTGLRKNESKILATCCALLLIAPLLESALRPEQIAEGKKRERDFKPR